MIYVIVPFHDAAKTLSDALKSVAMVREKTGLGFHVLAIDDHSKDDSKEIALSFGEFTEVLSAPNYGVSAARNFGLDYVYTYGTENDWVFFLDADDLLVKDAFMYFKERTSFSKLDYISFCFISANNKQAHNELVTSSNALSDNQELILEYSPLEAMKIAITSLDRREWNLNSPWAKLMKVHFLKQFHAKFNESLAYKEDLLFNLECFEHRPRIAIVKVTAYCYINNSQSVVHGFIKSAFHDELIVNSAISKLNIDERTKRIAVINGVLGLTYVYVFPKFLDAAETAHRKSRYDEVRRFLIGSKVSLLDLKRVSLKNKIVFAGYFINSFAILSLIFRLKGRK